MGKAQRTPPRLPSEMTVDEFFAWEGDGTDRKFELVDGVLRAMAPAAPTHSLLQARLTTLLATHLERNKLPCLVGTAPGVIPKVQANANYRIPDVGVFCGRNLDNDRVLENPVLLVEVLSPGNKAKTWTNIWAYTTIASVKQLLVIGSTKVDVKLITRLPDGTWPDTPQSLGREDQAALTCIEMVLPVVDIYRGTRLGAE